MITYIIISFLVIIAGICKSIQDTLAHHYWESIFSNSKLNCNYWNVNISYSNKYKNGIRSNGEKFLFSTTLLVWLTDAWHLFSTIENISIYISIATAIYIPESRLTFILIIIISKILYTSSFELFYKYVWLKK